VTLSAWYTSKTGYHTEKVELRKGPNPTLLGNALFGGVIGLGVDLVSGSAVSLQPERVDVQMAALRPGEGAIVREWNSRPATDQTNSSAGPASHAGSRVKTSSGWYGGD
jgi:hypothetical protein